jgi:hydrogenase-4 component B
VSDPIPVLLLSCASLPLVLSALLAAGLLSRYVAAAGTAASGLAGAVPASIALLRDQPPAPLEVPVGLPGMTLHLLADPLSGFFLLLLLLSGGATVVSVILAHSAKDGAVPIAAAVCLASLVLALLAADGVGLGLGFAMASLSLWAMRKAAPATTVATAATVAVSSPGTLPVACDAAHPSPAGAPADTVLRTGLLGAGSLFLVTALLSAGPPDGLCGAVTILLLATGPAGLLGLVPLHGWPAPNHALPLGYASALVAGQVMPVAAYALIRVLLDAEQPLPGWWSLPLLVVGAAGSLLGPSSAALRPELDYAVAGLARRQSGLLAIGIGIGVLARASDLPDLVHIALGALLLLVVAQSVCGTLATLAAEALIQAAGARRIDHLGGLVQTVPVAVAVLVAGLFGLTALPLGLGFGGVWLLFHAVLDAPRTEGLLSSALVTLLIAAVALSGAVAAAAFVRIVGVACLGRPRLPRVAAAEEIASPARLPLAMLAGLAAVLGLFPGLLLRGLADPVARQLTGGGLADHGGVLGLYATGEGGLYAPLPLALVLGLAGAAVFLLYRRHTVLDQTGGAWNDGFAPPPVWLPFGDPRTQANGAGFVPAWRKPALPALRQWRLTLPPPLGAWAVLLAAAVLLTAGLWWGSA